MTSPFAHPNPGGLRSPERILSVLSDVGEYWRANPDQRLAQVILNATKHLGVDTGRAYNVEDAPLVGALRDMLDAQPPAVITCYRLVPMHLANFLSRTLPCPDFRDWFSRHRPGIGRLSDCMVLTTDMVASLLTEPDLPTDDAGVEWATKTRIALERTEADSWRPYDSVVIPGHHRIHADLSRLADEVEQTSPMLSPVVEGIDYLLHVQGNTIGTYRDIAETRIGEEFFGDTGARWDHIETFVPSLRARLVTIVDDLLAGLPVPAEDDGFAARTPDGQPQ